MQVREDRPRSRYACPSANRDAQNIVFQNQTGRDIYIEHADRIPIIVPSGLANKPYHLPIEIQQGMNGDRLASGYPNQTARLPLINGYLLVAWDTLFIA